MTFDEFLVHMKEHEPEALEALSKVYEGGRMENPHGELEGRSIPFEEIELNHAGHWINRLMTWDRTSQGYNYWYDVCERNGGRR